MGIAKNCRITFTMYVTLPGEEVIFSYLSPFGRDSYIYENFILVSSKKPLATNRFQLLRGPN